MLLGGKAGLQRWGQELGTKMGSRLLHVKIEVGDEGGWDVQQKKLEALKELGMKVD